MSTTVPSNGRSSPFLLRGSAVADPKLLRLLRTTEALAETAEIERALGIPGSLI